MDMAQLYPSLFSFHLAGVSLSHLVQNRRGGTGENNLPKRSTPPTASIEFNLRGAGASMYARQKQFLDRLQGLSWLSPEQRTLKNIIAYAATKPTS